MKFRASEMPRVQPCPGSKHIEKLYAKPENPADSLEGDIAHKISAEILTGKRTLISFANTEVDGMFVDMEMINHIRMYTDFCTTKLDSGVGAVEQEYIQDIHGNILSGHPDHWCYSRRALYINDLKFGHGPIEVYMNWQLLTYVALIFFLYPEIEKECTKICLTIIQPRARHADGPVRDWYFDSVFIRNYRNQIINSIGEASQIDTADISTKTGDHCRYCDGLLQCHTYAAAAGYALDYSKKMTHSGFTPEQFAMEYELIEKGANLLKWKKEALEEEGLALCKNGTMPPGWIAKATMGNLAWNRDAIAIGDAMSIDLRKDESPITPTQAISRGLLTEEQVKAFAARKLGSMKLQRMDNAKAKRILENVK